MNTPTNKQKNQLRTAWESLQASQGRLRKIEKAFIKASRAVGEWLEIPNLSLLSPEDAVDAATATAEQESACATYAGASHQAEPTEQLLAWYLAQYQALKRAEQSVELSQNAFDAACREAGLDRSWLERKPRAGFDDACHEAGLGRDLTAIENHLRAEYRNRVLEDAKED